MSVHKEGKALVKAILDRKGVKLCSTCKLTKPFSGFLIAYTNKKGEVSYRHDCRDCQNARRREWRRSNPTGEAQMAEYDATLKYQADKQAETKPHATNNAEVWSGEDDRLLLDNLDKSNKELAILLGRSYTAVARRKTVLRKRGKL